MTVEMTPARKERLSNRYPTIEDLRLRAHQRLPKFVKAYLETGTGDEYSLRRNRDAFDAITLLPRYFRGPIEPELSTSIFSQNYSAPFGVAPIGMPGLIWPGTEAILARAARSHGTAFCLSIVASETPESIGPLAPENAWFQLYPTPDRSIRDDILDRASAAGFQTLVVTADVPRPSRRETLRRAGMRMPPGVTPGFVAQSMLKPVWTQKTLSTGLPQMKTIAHYASGVDTSQLPVFFRDKFPGQLDWNDLTEIRARWNGPLIVKGLLHKEDIERAIDFGAEGIVVSNHGGRQFNGGPAPIDVLPTISKQVAGRVVVIYDSGVRSGLDIIRAIAGGADFVLLGRPFLYATAALGEQGGNHVMELLIDDIKNNMVQLGVSSVNEIRQLEQWQAQTIE